MSLRRTRILLAVGVSSSLLAGFAVAESSGALSDPVTPSSETTLDTVGESSQAATTETFTETSGTAASEMVAVEILPPDEPWAGVTRGEWEARSWQWVLSMPDDINPWRDTTGERCGYGQSGPVFFLPGANGEITCVVAEGTAIYVNVVGTECSTVEPEPYFGRTEDELRACATASLDIEVAEFEARIDGRAVADLEAYRIGSPLFNVTFPEDNVLGVEPGVAQAVSDSYSFIILPPPPGEYEITSTVLIVGESGPRVLTHTVIVETPQVIESPPTT
jgi:hypothetical protein